MKKNRGPQGPTNQINPSTPVVPTGDPAIEPGYTASSLAAAAGISTRTVHYYRNEGLLPPPEGRGKGAHYGEDHLKRLRVIRDGSRSHLPLSEIRNRLNSDSDHLTDLTLASSAGRGPESRAALEALFALEDGEKTSVNTGLLSDPTRGLARGIAQGFIDTGADFDGEALGSIQAQAGNSAADYSAAALRAMRGPFSAPPGIGCPICGSIMVRDSSSSSGYKCLNCGSPSGLLRGVHIPPKPIGWTAPAPLPTDVPNYKYPPISTLGSVTAGSRPASRTTGAGSRRTHSTWERIPLCADIEIHAQRPTSRPGNRALARIIEAATAIIEEEKLS